MPIDPSMAISAIAGIGQGLQGIITGSQNREQRKWSESMYDRQRKDALADWNMQNVYNSPQEQMKRFEAAGLNKNLIYGQNAGSAPAVRSSSVEPYNPKSIMVDMGQIGSALGMYYDIQVKQAQTDNLKAQKDVILQDAALRAAQVAASTAGTAKTEVDTQQSKFNLSMAEKLQGVTLETAQRQLHKLNADIDYTLDSNERQQAAATMSLQEAAERILNSRSSRAVNDIQRKQIQEQINNLRKDVTLKQLDIELKRMGIMPGDPMWSRVLGRVVGDPKVQEKAKDVITGKSSAENDKLLNNRRYMEYLERKKKK